MSDIDVFLKPDSETPSSPADTAPEQSAPLTLDDAFSKLVEQMEKGSAQPASAPAAKDPSLPSDDAISQAQSNEATQPGTGQQTPQVDEAKELRDKLLADKDAQINLYKSRLSDLSQQYNALKGVSEKLYASASANLTPEASQAMPDKLKEFKELYPDVYDAMELYVERKVGNPAAVAEQIATEKAALVAQQVQQMQTQQHVTTILNKHPDLYQIIRSEDARQWFHGLDPVAKKGAAYVLNYGTATDVINLMDQYKASKASPAGTHNSKQNSTEVNSLASKVANAVGVKSGRPDPRPLQQANPEKPLSQEEAFARLAREWEKDPLSLR